MSDEIRTRIASMVDCASVSYRTEYAGETKRDAWQCDAWRAFFAYPGKPEQCFKFFTGMGLRAAPTALSKAQARMSLPRLTQNDIDRRTIYGKRYLSIVESMRKPAAPHVADVLHSLILDASACEMSFAQWCAECGSSSDSIKALSTYRACQENTDKLRQIFSTAQINALRDALQDY